jgi:hypothetical protein
MTNIEDNHLCYLGQTEVDKAIRTFGILKEDRRRHTYVLGKSGMGKSTLLENMILQDIYSGYGCCFIDPLGDSAESIIFRIPNYRVKDVIYFNPIDINFPISINLIDETLNQNKDLVIAEAMSIMSRLWEGTWSARMEYILRNAILALMDMQNQSLLGVLKMFNNEGFLKEVSNSTKNLVVKEFWTREFPSFSESYRTKLASCSQVTFYFQF